MNNRRALIVAPLYGRSFPILAGGAQLVEQLGKCLHERGLYDVQSLTNQVTKAAFREKVRDLFDTDGEVLFYFYGHGCLNIASHGVFVTSDGTQNDEGVLMLEVITLAQQSKAREAVIILDCCHAGAAAAPILSEVALHHLAQPLTAQGRALLAGCDAHQHGWERKRNGQTVLGDFSACVLTGLNGAARGLRGTVGATDLSTYVTDEIRSWKQRPITRISGSDKCVITSHFADLETQKVVGAGTCRILGEPFRPSQFFVGRESELTQLRSVLLKDKGRVAISAAIEGLGGIGKTELVVQLIYDPEVQAVYRTIVWLDASGPILPQWENVIRKLGASPYSNDDRALVGQAHELLTSQGSALVVFDNATTWDELRPLAPQGLPTLITTRSRDFGLDEFNHLELGVLSSEAARDFLTRIVPELAQDPGLSVLITAIDGHALALELAAWNIRKQGITANEYLQLLDTGLANDDTSSTIKTKYRLTVEQSLAVTWNALQSDEARKLWRVASLFAPVSAHRNLLRTSFIGLHYNEILSIIDQYDLRPELFFTEEELKYDPFSWYEKDDRSTVFGDAYQELRDFHVLARVEGAGQRWAMHRLVREFGRKRLLHPEPLIHLIVLVRWLRNPDLDLLPEVPHFVAAILDSVRYGAEQTLGPMGSAARFGLKRAVNIAARGSFGLLDTSTELFSIDLILRYVGDALQDPGALNLMFEGLTDPNDRVRIEAIKLLERVAHLPEVNAGLARLLADPNYEARRRAREAIIEHGGNASIQILLRIVESENPRLREEACQTLCSMRHTKQTEAALHQLISSRYPQIRAIAAVTLAERGDQEAVNYLLKNLDFPDLDRKRVFSILGKSCSPQAAAVLVAYLNDVSHASIAFAALNELGAIAFPALIGTLQDVSLQKRIAAAILLAQQGKFEGISTLLHLLKTEAVRMSENVLKAAIESLAVAAGGVNLKKVLSYNDTRVRQIAITTLIANKNSIVFEWASPDDLRGVRLSPHRMKEFFPKGATDTETVVIARRIAPYAEMPSYIVDLVSPAGEQAHALLLELLDSADTLVRVHAALALCKQQNLRGIDTLLAEYDKVDKVYRKRLRATLVEVLEAALLNLQSADHDARQEALRLLSLLRKQNATRFLADIQRGAAYTSKSVAIRAALQSLREVTGDE